MGIKKFIESVKEVLGLDEFEKTGKKKSVKRLLKKLRSRKEILDNILKKDLGKKEKKALQEELDIVTLQIKKGEKILNKLNAQSSAKIKKI